MPKNYKEPDTSVEEDRLLLEAKDHYKDGVEDMEKRRDRKNGWNDILKAYHGELPDNWPYLSKVNNPLIRTTVLEKTSRLFNGKLKGKLVPREGGDVSSARINNAIIDYQWDAANEGGSMIEKWALMDIYTRLFGSAFALVYWKYETDEDGNTTFEGNEFKPLDNRDVFIDYTANHVKNANWAIVREWKTIEELEGINDNARENGGSPLYKNLDKLVDRIMDEQSESGGDRRKEKSELKRIRGMEERLGTDKAFPVVEIATEYRKDKWIIFAPKYNLILNVIDNPYEHGQIPIAQLRYYPVGDDVYGESEVESVLPLWRADNAMMCGAIDEANLTMRPPIKVAHADSTVRTDTLNYGPNAVWKVGSSVNNVAEHNTSGAFVRNFQTMHSAIVSAFNLAMGANSIGTSNLDPFDSGNPTATEVRAAQQQKLTRDQYNQMYLEQALKDQMMLWVANNKQFLFDDEDKKVHILRIVGKDMIKDLQNAGLDETETDPEAMDMISKFIAERGGEVDDAELELLNDITEVPSNPVALNPEADNILEMEIVPQLEVKEDYAELRIVPDDLGGMYDYIPDIESLALGTEAERKKGRSEALAIATNPQIKQELQEEGYSLEIKELITRVLEDNHFKNADKFIKKFDPQQNAQQGQQQRRQQGQPNPGGPQGAQPPSPNEGGNADAGMEALGELPQSPVTGQVPGPQGQ